MTELVTARESTAPVPPLARDGASGSCTMAAVASA
jgi:hypothetical protein